MNGAHVREALESEREPAPKERREEEPVFEIRVMSRLAGLANPVLHHLKIWGDGYCEGLESIAQGNPVRIDNRIPMLLDVIVQPLREYVEDVNAAINKLAPQEEDAVG